MDKTTKVFDSWAKAGRAEEMEEGHGVTVGKFLGSISFDKPFSFLDIGCGNGWVVRKIAQLPKCKKAVGIDKSKNMVKRAISKQASKKEKYACTDLESWDYVGKFDIIFSMESLYYSFRWNRHWLWFSRCSRLVAHFIVELTFTATTTLPKDGKKL